MRDPSNFNPTEPADLLLHFNIVLEQNDEPPLSEFTQSMMQHLDTW